MTPVEEIRRAAALMRERAKIATPGPWTVEDDDDGTLMGVWSATHTEYVANPYDDWPPGREDCEHIASWHPGVAVAVADWLDAEAILMENFEKWTELIRLAYTRAAGDDIGFAVQRDPEGTIHLTAESSSRALAVARAYLGSQP